ncbi:hypothetical protein NOAM109506_03115 [Nosocomiicoccus ampullae]|uniref:Uncharacterized protein n=2 Tax=Nosocomiicoccus ampullae TaxID=489910 RepID=A0A9Q2CW43_9STAP|nr:hypothetical protein [Nosocomiicoccus ampullae]
MFQYILWFVAYTPLLVLIIYGEIRDYLVTKNIFAKYEMVILLIIITIIYIVTYKLVPTIFINMKKKKSKTTDIIQIKKYDKISANEYTFFVLSLLMPFLFLEFRTQFDYFVLLVILNFIILIMVKTEYIIINPIFLFSGYKIYYAVFKDGDRIVEGYILVKDKKVLKSKSTRVNLFDNVYYLYNKS